MSPILPSAEGEEKQHSLSAPTTSRKRTDFAFFLGKLSKKDSFQIKIEKDENHSWKKTWCICKGGRQKSWLAEYSECDGQKPATTRRTRRGIHFVVCTKWDAPRHRNKFHMKVCVLACVCVFVRACACVVFVPFSLAVQKALFWLPFCKSIHRPPDELFWAPLESQIHYWWGRLLQKK